MRIDVLTIFPGYLAPLELSLIGRARREGLLDLRVHDLRDWTHDRHRTVDGTPYGGGAGMVLRPEPWGEALDDLVADGAALGAPHLLVPSPAGVPLTQRLAAQWATEPWLVIGCGRYEGIDERVLEHATPRMPVTPVSLGDYVLNGGEVAALAITEAVVRLLPGVVGNAASLVEESHEHGLLEHPVYTKPPVWRGHAVPEVLLSGDHGAIAAWRAQQQRERTVARRPDLLPAAAALDGLAGAEVRQAVPADAEEILVLQRACWLEEARDNARFDIPALEEDVEDVRAGLTLLRTWVVRSGGRLVASVRAGEETDDRGERVWRIGRLMVAPDLRGRGLGQELLALAEAAAPEGTSAYVLITGGRSAANLRRYGRSGYRVVSGPEEAPGAVSLRKKRV